MKPSCYFFFLLSFVFYTNQYAQTIPIDHIWPAHWICDREGPMKEFAVYHFRKSFNLDKIPDSLIIHTSGDNRYQLFVNEKLATWGPARGDLRHWHYETTNIAPFLRKGKNVLAAVVWNYGSHPPDAQLTVQTGFLLCANRYKYKHINTNKNWKVIHNRAYTPNIIGRSQINGYYGGGSREIVDGNKYIWGWNEIQYNDNAWNNAYPIETAKAKKCIWPGRWKLTPSQIKKEKLIPEKEPVVRMTEGDISGITTQLPVSNVTIAAGTKARIILDQGYETTAYPSIMLSKGKNASLQIRYVEAPYQGDPGKKEKGNRNIIKGKTFFGYWDKFIADGGEKRIYTPLWWRAYRYIELIIETDKQPLIINKVTPVFSTYPFEMKASFDLQGKNLSVSDTMLTKIIKVGTRTMQLCSHETFMDCPYYEESQFEGDARIEALISYYNYGDPALGKNAIEQFSWSVNDEGFLSARYPTNSVYYIPNYSIFWIGMLHDYMMYYGDKDYIHSKMQIVRTIMNYFLELKRDDGTIKKPDYHNFVDWSFDKGEAPIDDDGYSALVDLHVLRALQWSANLEAYAGNDHFRKKYESMADQLSHTIKNTYWNYQLGLFTDIPGKNKLSQHTNCMAIITGLSKGEEAKKIMQQVLTNKQMVQATIYWHFYLFEALHKSGLGGQYIENLDTWKKMINHGCTTWPETGLQSRSECHGWGASPNLHLLKIIAGIDSDAPGFKKIKVEPFLGKAQNVKADIPHPNGNIDINISRNKKDGITGSITLPNNTTGTFLWNGKEIILKEGFNQINF